LRITLGIIIAPRAGGAAHLPFDYTGLCVAAACYSIKQPSLHRACPNNLQVIKKLLKVDSSKRYRRMASS
jgi:hypothetical protein